MPCGTGTAARFRSLMVDINASTNKQSRTFLILSPTMDSSPSRWTTFSWISIIPFLFHSTSSQQCDRSRVCVKAQLKCWFKGETAPCILPGIFHHGCPLNETRYPASRAHNTGAENLPGNRKNATPTLHKAILMVGMGFCYVLAVLVSSGQTPHPISSESSLSRHLRAGFEFRNRRGRV